MYGQMDPLNQPGGFGIFQQKSVFASKYLVHANCEITVLDGRQFESRARNGIPGAWKFWCVDRAAFREVDSSWWPANTDVSANQQLKKAVNELTERSLLVTLREMRVLD